MLRLSALFTGAKFVLALWTVSIVITSLATLSAMTMLIFRHLYLPTSVLQHKIDFVPKNIREVGQPNVTSLQAAIVDLSNVKLISSEDYTIEVILDFPRNPSNRQSKNFPIGASLANNPWHSTGFRDDPHLLNTRTTYNSVERMASLPYHSDMVETCRNLVMFPLYLTGALEEKSTLAITLWHKAKSPLRKQPHLMIYIPDYIWVSAASIRLTVRLSGLRWLLQQYPVFSFMCGSSIIFMSQLTGTVLFLLWAYRIFASSKQDAAVAVDTDDNTLIGDETEETVTQMSRKARKRERQKMQHRKQL